MVNGRGGHLSLLALRTPGRARSSLTSHASAPRRRYHYNVNTSRLLVHVQKGWEDGLYISCVSSCQNLWAIVMDAGTDYTQQIYKVRAVYCGGSAAATAQVWAGAAVAWVISIQTA